LRDAYRFAPDETGLAGRWETLPELPRPTAAAPTPSPALPSGEIVILGGVDGSKLQVPPEKHIGFDRTLLVYDVEDKKWAEIPNALPAGSPRVTAPVAPWRGGWVVVSGEKSPGRRSPDVQGFRGASVKD
jgi:hypothetical protein